MFLEAVQVENVQDQLVLMVERFDYANSLDPDQARQNVWHYPKGCNPNCDPESFSRKDRIQEMFRTKRYAKLHSMQIVK